jgi:hypothetical protein
MNIAYLKKLRDYPVRNPNATELRGEIEGLPLSEIEQLETNWNNGNPFPKSLRELLFLAGEYCYVLDYGAYDSLDQIQEYKREDLLEYHNITINRPYFIIDVYGGNITFVYLDESQEDPTVHYIEKYSPLVIGNSRLLSKYIEAGIENVKKGYNPF